MPGTWAIGGMPIPKSLTFAFETGVVPVAGTAPEKPHRNLGGFKNPNGVQYLCAAANSTVSHSCSPKNLTFPCEHRTANVEIRSRKGSPVQETGTVKRRFFPRQAGFPAISTGHHSRKASPMRNLCADPAPEKAHLERVRPTVKRIPKKLTIWLSRQMTRRFGPENPHLCGATGIEWRFWPAKPTSFPGNPHIKSPRSPVKPHLSEKLPKSWAKTGRKGSPANSHLCLHRQKTVHAAAVRVARLCAPEKPHLCEFPVFTVIPNPLTTFPATAHAVPRTPSRRLPQKVTLSPVKLHLVGRRALLHKAVPWR